MQFLAKQLHAAVCRKPCIKVFLLLFIVFKESNAFSNRIPFFFLIFFQLKIFHEKNSFHFLLSI